MSNTGLKILSYVLMGIGAIAGLGGSVVAKEQNKRTLEELYEKDKREREEDEEES